MPLVSVDVTDEIANVHLDDADHRNALSESMAKELLEALQKIDADRSIAVTLVTAAGPYFCAGGDRKAIQDAVAHPTSQAALDGRSVVYDACRALRALATPTIVAVRGGAVGAGLNLVLCADIIISEPGARFASGFQAVGLHPGGGIYLLLREKIGLTGAAAVGLMGEAISAERALELGLVWELEANGDVEGRARALASSLSGRSELSRSTTASFRNQTFSGAELSQAAAADEWGQYRSILELGR